MSTSWRRKRFTSASGSKVRDAVYEIASEPTRWGAAWTATVKIVEGLKPGGEFRAMIHTGRRVK